MPRQLLFLGPQALTLPKATPALAPTESGQSKPGQQQPKPTEKAMEPIEV